MVAGVVVGVAVAIVGAIGNYIASVKRDERQYERQRQIQEELWKREDRQLFKAERIQTYKEFHRAATAYIYERDAPSKMQSGPNSNRIDELSTKLIDDYSDVYTFATLPVMTAAKGLLDAALKGSNSIADARLTFLERAQEELGVHVEPPDSDS